VESAYKEKKNDIFDLIGGNGKRESDQREPRGGRGPGKYFKKNIGIFFLEGVGERKKNGFLLSATLRKGGLVGDKRKSAGLARKRLGGRNNSR